MTVTLSRSQYESLVAAAKGDTQIDVDGLTKTIDRDNNIKRFLLRIRWIEPGSQPFSIREGTSWPPEMSFTLRQDRAIAREDVDEVIRTNAISPVDIQVTPDPHGFVGWTDLDVFDFYLQ